MQHIHDMLIFKTHDPCDFKSTGLHFMLEFVHFDFLLGQTDDQLLKSTEQ